MGKKNEEKTVERSETGDLLAELCRLMASNEAALKSIDASLKTIVAAIQKPQSIHVGR